MNIFHRQAHDCAKRDGCPPPCRCPWHQYWWYEAMHAILSGKDRDCYDGDDEETSKNRRDCVQSLRELRALNRET